METFGNNVCTCFISSARPPNCYLPHMSFSKSRYLSIVFTVTVGLPTSAKGSAWDVAWLSNASGLGRRTRFSRYLSHSSLDSSSLLNLRIAVLQGNYRLEGLVSPKHLASFGSVCLRGSPVFLHRLRLDAKRERDGIHQVQSRGPPSAVGEPTCRFPMNAALTILDDLQLSEVMSGATYLHELGVVHGDLKGVPSNVPALFSSFSLTI